MALTIEKVDRYFQQRPYYWTDGVHFRANLSGRKRKGWRYLGRFLNAKEARAYYERAKEVCPSAFKKRFDLVFCSQSEVD